MQSDVNTLENKQTNKQKRCLSQAAILLHHEAMSSSMWKRNASVWSVKEEHFGGLSLLNSWVYVVSESSGIAEQQITTK